MGKSIRPILLSAAIAAVFAFTACGPPQLPTDEAVEMRAYSVQEQYKDDLRAMLQVAMGANEGSVGRVTNGPGGTLLVVASPRIHAGVRKVLDEMEGLESPPPPPGPVSLTYWFVVGQPRDPASTGKSFEIAGGKSALQLTPALEQIASAQGPTTFSVLEQMQLTTMSQERGEAGGRFARIEQRAWRTAGNIVADLQIQIDNNRVASQVMLEPGQFLVLGQSGYAGRGPDWNKQEPPDDMTLYYVMVADLEP